MVYMVLFITGWHLMFMNYWSILDSIEKRTWIWGDSQMVQGIDPKWLDLDKPPFSIARHGNGYFDLISFSHRLPNEAEAIVGFGPLYYRYRKDRSQAGFQWEALTALYEVFESKAFEVNPKEILRNNVYHEFSTRNFTSDGHGRYSNQPDSLKRLEYIDNIIEVIHKNEFDALFQLKDKWLLHSIAEMNEKSNRLIIISWPVCDQLYGTEFIKIQHHYDSVLYEISDQYTMPLDTLSIVVEQDPFHDATHFADHAVNSVTERMRDELKSKTGNRIFVIRFKKIE